MKTGQIARSIVVFSLIALGSMLFAVACLYFLAIGGSKYQHQRDYQDFMENSNVVEETTSVGEATAVGEVQPMVYTGPTDFKLADLDVQVTE